MGKCDGATGRTWMVVSATNSNEVTNSLNSASEERPAICSTGASACSPLVYLSGCRTDYRPDCCNLRITQSPNC